MLVAVLLCGWLRLLDVRISLRSSRMGLRSGRGFGSTGGDGQMHDLDVGNDLDGGGSHGGSGQESRDDD